MTGARADGEAGAARAAAVVTLGAASVRTALAAGMGLGVDESYMEAAGRTWSLSYFDHPPLAWWLVGAARAIGGPHDDLVLRLPFLALGAATTWLFFLVTRRLWGARAGLAAVVALTAMPVFSLAVATWILPDGPLDFFLLAAAWAALRALGIDRAEAPPAPRFWALAGLCAGLALLSKYNAGLALAGVGLFLLTDRRGRVALRGPWPWIALAIAAAVFAPVIAWNAAHGWASFAFQGGRADGFSVNPLRPFVPLAGQALYVTPWLWAPAFALGLRVLFKRDDPAARLLAFAAFGMIAPFALVALWSPRPMLPHWGAPGYVLLMPLVGRWSAGLSDRAFVVARRVAAATLALLAIAAAVIAGQGFFGVPAALDARFDGLQKPSLQANDWSDLPAELEKRGFAPRAGLVFAVGDWRLAGKVGHALDADAIVAVLGDDERQFGYARPWTSLLGDDVLMLGDAASDPRYASAFESVERLAPLPIRHAGRTIVELPAAIGRRLKTPPR
ncbi:MAG: glycosyltransferase family 39 protein [Hyphomicrobiales bacterium]|nr:glycosyltransferase family 39 protein [Hyphomicrobiales bacterium]